MSFIAERWNSSHDVENTKASIESLVCFLFVLLLHLISFDNYPCSLTIIRKDTLLKRNLQKMLPKKSKIKASRSHTQSDASSWMKSVARKNRLQTQHSIVELPRRELTEYLSSPLAELIQTMHSNGGRYIFNLPHIFTQLMTCFFKKTTLPSQ